MKLPCLWQWARIGPQLSRLARLWLEPLATTGVLLRRHLISAAVCAVVCTPACAEVVDLGEQNLKAMVAGKTVHLDTPFGVAIPITYHANGLMSGKAGVLEHFLGAQVDRGRWWVAGGKLCQKWFKWLDAQPSCMRLKQDGDKIIWRRDDGLNGTATIASGLALGAEAAPRGVGGPRQTPEFDDRRAAAIGAADEVPAKITSPPPAPRRITKTASAHMGSGVGSGPPHAASLAVAASGASNGERSAALAQPMPPGSQERWCHAFGAAEIGAEEARADATPELVRVARLTYGDATPAWPSNACLAEEPPLQNLARGGVEAR